MELTRNIARLLQRVLPTVQILERHYFIDLESHQFRNTEDPQDTVAFPSDEGRRMCIQAGVLTCPRCGTSVIIALFHTDAPLHCISCGLRLGWLG